MKSRLETIEMSIFEYDEKRNWRYRGKRSVRSAMKKAGRRAKRSAGKKDARRGENLAAQKESER